MQEAKMAGPFATIPHEVYRILRELKYPCMTAYVGILVNFHLEHEVEVEGEWVLGKIEASLGAVARKLKMNDRWFRYKIFSEMTDAGLLRQPEGEDGVIEILKLYRKNQAYFVPLENAKELKRLQSDNSTLKSEMAGIKNLLQHLAANPELISKKPALLDKGKPPQGKKKDNGSLSGEKIISMFYKGIGQDRISASKREKARLVYKKLRADKFTPEEIGFAVQWTLENAKERPYDFALLLDTIGQAVAARQKADSKQEAVAEREGAVDREREEREKEEQERDDWEFYKAELPEQEREELRARATKQLADSGEYTPQFTTDILIGIKETEILRREFPEGIPVGAETGEGD